MFPSRPISLLCSVSSIDLSSIMFPIISIHFSLLISSASFLIAVYNKFFYFFQNYSSHKQTDIVYLDFCKACIPHTELKINQLGISGFWNGFNPICHVEDNLFSLMVFTRPCYPSHLSASGQQPSFVCHFYKWLIKTSSWRHQVYHYNLFSVVLLQNDLNLLADCSLSFKPNGIPF